MKNKTKSNQPEPHECLCGCGEHTKGGRYVQGHDARHKSALITAALDGDKRAVMQLDTFGWKKFLDAKLVRMGLPIAPVEPEPVKRKRGRPRKNDGAVVLATSVSALRRAASRIRLEPVEPELVS